MSDPEWDSPEVTAYLRSRDFMRARDQVAAGHEERKGDAVRRGMQIPSSDTLLALERVAAARTAFPALAEEIKRLVTSGRIPESAGGREFAFRVVRSIYEPLKSFSSQGDEIHRASIRAEADLRLFFQATALPTIDIAEHFLAEMERLVPTAAAAYRQAVSDLRSERLSYRGPANELRQALWSVLQELAPDDDVIAEPDFRLEGKEERPTHRQRAKFILRKRHEDEKLSKSTLATIDTVAALARQIYERANASTHNQKDREEALQLQRYVEAVLRDLLR